MGDGFRAGPAENDCGSIGDRRLSSAPIAGNPGGGGAGVGTLNRAVLEDGGLSAGGSDRGPGSAARGAPRPASEGGSAGAVAPFGGAGVGRRGFSDSGAP